MKRKTNYRWIIQIIILSITMSVLFTVVSESVLEETGYFIEFTVLLLFIIIGIIFDIIGVAVTSADETPFHSMASHREKGAAEAIKLVKSADKVSSICNDVVGDISGIVSGATSAVIVASLVRDFKLKSFVMQLIITGIVAGITIGGKALGKNTAINNNTKIVLFVGKLLHFLSGRSKKNTRQ